jgi:hypothetical protein
MKKMNAVINAKNIINKINNILFNVKIVKDAIQVNNHNHHFIVKNAKSA